MVPYIKRYNWQCNECKSCAQCKEVADEDKMLFCDLCDRGYSKIKKTQILFVVYYNSLNNMT